MSFTLHMIFYLLTVRPVAVAITHFLFNFGDGRVQADRKARAVDGRQRGAGEASPSSSSPRDPSAAIEHVSLTHEVDIRCGNPGLPYPSAQVVQSPWPPFRNVA